jgi:hypothetical protein
MLLSVIDKVVLFTFHRRYFDRGVQGGDYALKTLVY